MSKRCTEPSYSKKKTILKFQMSKSKNGSKMTIPTDIENWRKYYVEKSEIQFGNIALKIY